MEENIPKMLIEYRKVKNITQKELAEILTDSTHKFSLKSINNYENGKSYPTRAKLLHMFKKLHLDKFEMRAEWIRRISNNEEHYEWQAEKPSPSNYKPLHELRRLDIDLINSLGIVFENSAVALALDDSMLPDYPQSQVYLFEYRSEIGENGDYIIIIDGQQLLRRVEWQGRDLLRVYATNSNNTSLYKTTEDPTIFIPYNPQSINNKLVKIIIKGKVVVRFVKS